MVTTALASRYFAMESILDKATQKMDTLEKKIAEYEEFQSEIKKLEAYYTSPQWKDDYAMDEAGEFPEKLKRGVLSQDGIFSRELESRRCRSRIMMSEKTKDRGNKGQTQNRPRMLKNIPGIATWGQIQKDRPHVPCSTTDFRAALPGCFRPNCSWSGSSL